MRKKYNRRSYEGNDNPKWRGGRLTINTGYILVLCKDHPRANRHGYVLEHILIAERALGHYLPGGAAVHHVDGNKSNNTHANLVICQDNVYHALLHKRERAHRATGDPHKRHCPDCDTWKEQEDFPAKKHGVCKECNIVRTRDYYSRNSERLRKYSRQKYARKVGMSR